MILSSRGCKVSWALRGGMRLLREPPGFHCLQVIPTSHKIRREQQLIRRSLLLNICRPLAEKLHRSLSGVRFHICEYSSGDEEYERLGLSPNPFTLFAIHRSVSRSGLSLPRRSSPAEALRHTTAVKIFLPCLLSLFLGWSCLVL